MGLKIRISVTNRSKLNACVIKQKQDRQDKLLYKEIYTKVTKKTHKYEEPTRWDGTLIKCKMLLQNGAKPSKLKLPEEDLKELSKEQKEYYSKFLNRLNKQIKQSKAISKEVKNQVEQVILQTTTQSKKNCCNAAVKKHVDSRRESHDSGAESGDETSASNNHDTTPLIPRSVEKLKGGEEISSIEKKSSRIDKVRTKFKEFKKNISIRKLVLSKKKEKNINLFSFKNPNYEFSVDDFVGDESGYDSGNESNCEGESKNGNDNLLEIITKGNLGKFKNLLNDGVDITAQDEKGNILHNIASLKGKQKFEFLKELEKNNTQQQQCLNQLVNGEDKNKKTPLQIALIAKIEKEEHKSNKPSDSDNTLKFLSRLLELGANPNQLELSEESLKKLSEEQKKYYRSFLEKLAKSGIESDIRTKIEETIANAINIKDSNGSYPLHLAIHNSNQKPFKELLQKGADISLKDKEGNNVLHRIALLEGEQKVTCLGLILKIISQDKLSEAINTKNDKGHTPLKLALIRKAEKGKEHLGQKNIIFDKELTHDNTTKFCAMLLKEGADPSSLELTYEKLHTDSYYLVLRDLKDYKPTPPEAQEKAKKLKEKLEEKYGCKTLSKKGKSAIKKTGCAIKKAASSTIRYLDPARRTRELLVITATITVITMVAFAFFQGQMAIEAAIPIIAVAGVICLIFTLGFSPIKKCFKKLSANEQNTSSTENHARPTTEQNQTSNNDQQNLGNNPENSVVQEPPAQLECEQNNPNTKINNLSIMGQFVNKYLGFSIG